jgi:prevent-host-death family protein
MMKKVTSADMARKFSEFCDLALNEPIVVTKNGRDRLVLLGVEEYNWLKELAAARAGGAREAGLRES